MRVTELGPPCMYRQPCTVCTACMKVCETATGIGDDVCRTWCNVVSDGLAKVFSVLTGGGPDKVRFKKNYSQIRYTWEKSGLKTVYGSRRRKVFVGMAISPGNMFLSEFSGPGCRGPPRALLCERTSGLKTF